jgi:hypothetical protein
MQHDGQSLNWILLSASLDPGQRLTSNSQKTELTQTGFIHGVALH